MPAQSGDIRINEVDSSGADPADWIELTNLGDQDEDLTGWVLRDDKDSHRFVIADGTTAPAHGYVAIVVDDGSDQAFGLGDADSARVFAPDGTLVDSYSWASHAQTTYGRCPDGTGEWTTTTSATMGGPNDCSPSVAINEVMTKDPAGGPDWIEVTDTGTEPVDLSGWVLRDDSDDHAYVIDDGTVVEPDGFATFDVGAEDQPEGGFGLGKSDSARLFEPDGTTLVDSESWSSHGDPTWGRCPDGTGDWIQTEQATKGGANLCPGQVPSHPWPGGADVRTVDPQGTWSKDLSGLAYDERDGSLWGVQDEGVLFKITGQGDGWAPAPGEWAAGKPLHYPGGSGDPDSEGVAVGDDGALYVAAERDKDDENVSRPSILRYDPTASGSDLTATEEWNLTDDLPGLGANASLEGVTEVPDDYLVAHGFVDQHTGAAYDPSDYPGHGGGVFFVGVEETGQVLGYALQPGGVATRVATVTSGFPMVASVEWEPERQRLWAACDDACQGRSATYQLDDTGTWATTADYDRPAELDNLADEGFAIAPRRLCIDGEKPVWWADDAADDGYSLREGTLDCTPPAATTTTVTKVPGGLRVTVSAAAGTPAGTVQLRRGGTLLGSATLHDGTVTVRDTDVHGASAAGVRAVYPGGDDFAGSSSGA